jgi:hypothetical protein
MRMIKKFQLDRMTSPIVMMPRGAKILRIVEERNRPIIWAICRNDAPAVKRLIRIFRSEEELPDEPGEYLNTITTLGCEWHCFDGGERIE